MIRPILFLAILSLGVAATNAQGSLNPSGPPGPTMKTLGQIEPRTAVESLPFRITSEGAYYLTGNLVVPNGTNGITIEASNVTLDLNGFTISGGESSEQGIYISGTRSLVTIRNGAIRGTTLGVDGATATKLRLESIRVSQTSGRGIQAGADAVIVDCQATACMGAGIHAGAGAQVKNSQSSGNTGNGFELGATATLTDCVAHKNTQDGVTAGNAATLIGMTAHENTGVGIRAGGSAKVTDCSVSSNKSDGMALGNNAFVQGCSAKANSRYGIQAGSGSSVIDASATSNGSSGLWLGESAHVSNCQADNNSGAGIVAARGSTVQECSVQRNTSDGIYVTSECTVTRNNCNNNFTLTATSGIHATGGDNVISENSCFGNDRGIAVDAGGNFIVKNTVSNNTLNFYSVGDQQMGPVVMSIDPFATFVHPMSNYVY